jgi:membrane-associated protease RseP (regulator of RpoE activity)
MGGPRPNIVVKPTVTIRGNFVNASLLLLMLPLVGDSAAKPARGAAAVARMKTDLFLLAGPGFEGRGINTPGIVKAAEHIREEFKKAGLKSGTADGSYFQPFDYGTEYKLTPGKNEIEIAGKRREIGKEVQPFALGAGKEFAGDIVFAGYGITAEGGAYDDYAGLDVAGKVVLVLRQMPAVAGANHPIFNKNSEARYASLNSKVDNAARRKAAAVLVVNDPGKAKELGADKLEDVNFAGRPRSNSIPYAQITQALADELLAETSLQSAARAAEIISKDVKPHSMQLKVKATGKFAFERDPKRLHNVVGVVEGAGPRANETVVIGAHYDHLGYGQFGSLAQAKDRSRIHFGADDNGSGTTTLLELARRFGSLEKPPARRLVFIAFCAEESGLIGSDHYASKAPLFPTGDTTSMVNLDMVGRLRNDAIEVAGNKSAVEFEPLLNELNSKYNFKLQMGPASIRGDSDHASFSKVGVPVLFFFTGMHKEYHKPTDTPDLINYEGMSKIADFGEELIHRLAEMPRPKFVPPPRGLFGMLGGGNRRAGGVTLGIMPKYNSQAAGVELEDVRDNSPASKAGLKSGDVIIEIGGAKVANVEEYMEVMSKQKAGQKLKVVVKRGKETKTLEAIPTAPAGAKKSEKK